MPSSSSPPGFFILADDVILRDERHYLESNTCFVRAPRVDQTVYLSVSAFELLVFLATGRTADEAWSHYSERCRVNGERPDRQEFDQFLEDLSGRGILERHDERLSRSRPLSNLGLKPSETAKIKPMTFPSRVSLVLTIRCNLTCSHCLRSSSPLASGVGELSTDEALSLMDELDNNGVTSLQLSGGEITVRKDIAEIASHVRSLRTHVEFLTNGYVLRPRMVDLLGDVQQAKGRGFHVHLSLDGGTAESNDWLRGRGAFDRTIAAMKALREAGVSLVVETCLTPKNLGELTEIAAICAEHGVRGLSIHPISLTGRGGCNPLSLPMRLVNRIADEADRLKQEYAGTLEIKFGYQFVPHARGSGYGEEVPLPPNTTGAGMFHMAIGADGKVYPCIESLGAEEILMGDVKEESTADIWRSERWDFFRGGWTVEELEDCRGCVFDGGCATQACRCYAVATGMGFYSPFRDCYENAEVLWGEKR